MIIPQQFLLSLFPSSLLRLLPHQHLSAGANSVSPSPTVELTTPHPGHLLPIQHSADPFAAPPVELEPLVSLPLEISGFYNNRGVTRYGSHKGEGFDGGGQATRPPPQLISLLAARTDPPSRSIRSLRRHVSVRVHSDWALGRRGCRGQSVSSVGPTSLAGEVASQADLSLPLSHSRSSTVTHGSLCSPTTGTPSPTTTWSH